MYFAKDEIIILNDNLKYLVLDTTLLNDNVYYKIQKLSDDEKLLLDQPKYIKAINKQGRLYINDNLSTDELNEINKLLED